MRKITIGITDCNKWKNYHDWFASEEVEVINLSYRENNLGDVQKCDGIVLSGGEDVHPKYYGKPSYMKRREELKLDVNELRDKFELQVIDKAVKGKKPILGICRGLQIANVYFKGTLIPNLPEKVRVHHSKNAGYDKTHEVNVEKDSCLNAIIRSGGGMVNSAHHQAVEKLGRGLRATAKDPSGIVEAIEWKNPRNKPFLLLVQWHPERMKEQKNPLAKNLRQNFLQAVMDSKKSS